MNLPWDSPIPLATATPTDAEFSPTHWRTNLTRQFKRSTRRLIALLLILPIAIMLLGTLYMLGSTYLEGQPRTIIRSIEWASETLTNTGYGADAHWDHPLMNLFVMFCQWLGIFIIFLIFPTYVLPFFEERFEARLDRSLPQMDGRILFHRYGPSVDFLIDELTRAGTPCVILEGDESQARSLRDRGFQVVVGNLDEDTTLLDGVERAKALVTAADDHLDVSFIMMSRERGYSGLICALAQNPLHREAMHKIGASVVYTPEHVLGAALASRASASVGLWVEGQQLLGEYVGLTEFRVHATSPLAGQRLGDLCMREQYGVTVIGQWVGGRFELATGPDMRIGAGVILVAVGAHDNLAKVDSLTVPIHKTGPILIAGHGAVGKKVARMLRDAGVATVVVDIEPADGVDIVGNVLDRRVLELAEVRQASAVVLALSNDGAGVLAAAVVRDFAPDVRLIARVNRAASVARLYQAGADFVLSMGQVAGQILAFHLLGENAISLEPRFKFARVAPGTLVGAHPWRTAVRERTGAGVVAVERKEEVIVQFDEGFQVEASDTLFVCGTIESVDRYIREFDAGISEPTS